MFAKHNCDYMFTNHLGGAITILKDYPIYEMEKHVWNHQTDMFATICS